MTIAKNAEEITRTMSLRWNISTGLAMRAVLEQMYLHEKFQLGEDGLYHREKRWEEWRPVLEVKNGAAIIVVPEPGE